MNVTFPIIELIDRYVIATVKFAKTDGLNIQEMQYYRKQIEQLPIDLISDEISSLQQIHEKIWSLESELKNGTEQVLSLEEIGSRAIAIRDWNNKRIKLKNHMADVIGTDLVREIKQQHLSE